MSYVSPHKVFAHLDRIVSWQQGQKPAPVTVEIDLSNVCSLGCQSCLTERAEVETMNRGRVSIADVNPGDTVLAYDETAGRIGWATVRAAAERPFSGSVYAIHVGHTIIEATGEHPFLTERGWVKAERLSTDDRLVCLSYALQVRLRPAGDAWPPTAVGAFHASDAAASARCHQRHGAAEGSDETLPVSMRESGVDERESLSSVLDREQGQAGSLRVWLRRVRQNFVLWCKGQGGAPSSGDAGQDCGRQASGQSNEEAGGSGQGSGEASRQEASECFGVAEAGILGRPIEVASDDRRVAPKGLRTDAGQQPDETTGDCREGSRHSLGEWSIHTLGPGVQSLLGREPAVSCRGGRAHEDAEPDVRHRHQGAQSEQDEAALAGIAARTVVRPVLCSASVSGLVHRDGSVLGQGSESGLQGPRSQTAHRSDGRVQPNAAASDYRELRDSHDSALRKARICLSGSDAASASPEPHIGTPGQLEAGGGSVHRNGLESGVVVRSIDRIDRTYRELPVYNLETSHGTYIANGLVVHNCHFAHTHVAGPWAVVPTDKPSGYSDTGKFADVVMVKRALGEMAAAGVRGVVYSGGGEPTLHPQFADVLEHGASLGLQQGLYTLGGHISGAVADACQYLTWVVVSLDCADAETYAKEKRVPAERFNAACAGIAMLVQRVPTVGVSFLLHAGNWREMYRMHALARTLGATYTTFRPTIETSPAKPSVCEADRAWVTDALPYLENFARHEDVECDPDRFVEYRDWTGHGYAVCCGIQLVTMVTPDGRVWVCPNRRGVPGSELGDLRRESFEDIWARHPGQWTDFADCRVMCRLHLVNRTLDEIAQPRAHEAFV